MQLSICCQFGCAVQRRGERERNCNAAHMKNKDKHNQITHKFFQGKKKREREREETLNLGAAAVYYSSSPHSWNVSTAAAAAAATALRSGTGK